MKYLVLVVALAGTAHAEGVVGASVGPTQIDACCNNGTSSWGVAAGFDAAKVFAFSWASLRVGGALEYSHGHQRATVGEASDMLEFDIDTEVLLARVELAVLHDAAFVWTGVGGALVTSTGDRTGLHVEGGVGARYHFTDHDALRVGASFGLNGVQDYGVFQYVIALGVEHYFSASPSR